MSYTIQLTDNSPRIYAVDNYDRPLEQATFLGMADAYTSGAIEHRHFNQIDHGGYKDEVNELLPLNMEKFTDLFLIPTMGRALVYRIRDSVVSYAFFDYIPVGSNVIKLKTKDSFFNGHVPSDDKSSLNSISKIFVSVFQHDTLPEITRIEACRVYFDRNNTPVIVRDIGVDIHNELTVYYEYFWQFDAQERWPLIFPTDHNEVVNAKKCSATIDQFKAEFRSLV